MLRGFVEYVMVGNSERQPEERRNMWCSRLLAGGSPGEHQSKRPCLALLVYGPEAQAGCHRV